MAEGECPEDGLQGPPLDRSPQVSMLRYPATMHTHTGEHGGEWACVHTPHTYLNTRT